VTPAMGNYISEDYPVLFVIEELAKALRPWDMLESPELIFQFLLDGA